MVVPDIQILRGRWLSKELSMITCNNATPSPPNSATFQNGSTAGIAAPSVDYHRRWLCHNCHISHLFSCCAKYSPAINYAGFARGHCMCMNSDGFDVWKREEGSRIGLYHYLSSSSSTQHSSTTFLQRFHRHLRPPCHL